MDRGSFIRSLIWGLVVSGGAAGQKGREKPKPATATIVGTVFREPGFALSGAEIILQPDPEPNASNKVKVKKMKAVSDNRGEFSFRVPAVALRYTLKFKAAGYQPETKQVSISGEERQDVYVTLQSSKEGSR
jgi:Carboxypeptidase regulatory-like domain